MGSFVLADEFVSDDAYGAYLKKPYSLAIQISDPNPIVGGKYAIPLGKESITLHVFSNRTKKDINDILLRIIPSTGDDQIESIRILMETNALEVKSKNSGQFVLCDNLPAGTWDLVIKKDGYAPLIIKKVTFPYKGVLEAELIALDKQVQGRLVNSLTKLPYVSCSVSCGGFTDKEGRFVCKNLSSSGESSINFCCPEFKGSCPNKVISQQDKEKNDIGDILFPPICDLNIKVLNSQGAAVPRQVVYAIPVGLPYSDAKLIGESIKFDLLGPLQLGEVQGQTIYRIETTSKGEYINQNFQGGEYVFVFGPIEKDIATIIIKPNMQPVILKKK